jgi:predicted RNase H-like HicB family nuclease
MPDFYVAILERNSLGEIFATVPDLPAVNAAAATEHEALTLAVDFANDYVRDLIADGHRVPPARDIDSIERDLEAPELGRALIPVDVPGQTIKISLSIDEALLKRADRAAAKAGMSRSGFFAAAALDRIAAAAKERSWTDEDVARAVTVLREGGLAYKAEPPSAGRAKRPAKRRRTARRTKESL